MISTLQTLQTIITPETRQMTLEDTATAYREDLNPSLLASAFSKNYNLILNLSKKYYGLTHHDLASFSLEELDYALQSYDDKKGVNFQSYFAKVLTNRLRVETLALNTQKRKAIFYSQSYETMVENGFDISDDHDFIDDMEQINLTGFTDRERKYCELVMKDYSNQDIAKIWGVSVMTLYHIRQSLRKKISPIALQY